MALCTIAKIKGLALAKQVVTGAFINGALVGIGVAVAVASAAKAADRRRGEDRESPV